VFKVYPGGYKLSDRRVVYNSRYMYYPLLVGVNVYTGLGLV